MNTITAYDFFPPPLFLLNTLFSTSAKCLSMAVRAALPLPDLDGVKDAMMTLQGSALPFLRLEVLVPRFAQQIHQGQ